VKQREIAAWNGVYQPLTIFVNPSFTNTEVAEQGI